MTWQAFTVRNTAGRPIGKIMGTSECDAYWAARAQYGSRAASVSIPRRANA